jgi:hypothetical protein
MSRPLDLKDARVAIRDRNPVLELTIAGRPATLCAEPKPTIFDAGLVFVGEDFDDILPDLTIVVEGRRVTLRGYSDDPRLFRLFNLYLEAEGPGPLAIPD